VGGGLGLAPAKPASGGWENGAQQRRAKDAKGAIQANRSKPCVVGRRARLRHTWPVKAEKICWSDMRRRCRRSAPRVLARAMGNPCGRTRQAVRASRTDHQAVVEVAGRELGSVRPWKKQTATASNQGLCEFDPERCRSGSGGEIFCYPLICKYAK